jgi:hypothetical protein
MLIYLPGLQMSLTLLEYAPFKYHSTHMYLHLLSFRLPLRRPPFENLVKDLRMGRMVGYECGKYWRRQMKALEERECWVSGILCRLYCL